MDHHMERHRAHSVVVGVTCPPRDHRVEHTKLVSCEPTMAIAWSTTGLKGCVGGVWHASHPWPSRGAPPGSKGVLVVCGTCPPRDHRVACGIVGVVCELVCRHVAN